MKKVSYTDVQKELEKARDEINENCFNNWIYNFQIELSHIHDFSVNKKIEFCVNWASFGQVTTSGAIDFTQELEYVIKITNELNEKFKGFEIEY